MKKYFVPLSFVLLGCGEHSIDEWFGDNNSLGEGLLQEENLNTTPKDVKNFSDADESSLPRAASIEDKFPPAQSQGSYGTCVAWSTGYAFKTALNAIERNWSSTDLAKPQNQTSPKDLWLAIPSGSRNLDCDGTSISAAMTALIAEGAASLSDVPYDMAKACNASPSTAKGNENNKLANYRKIAENQVTAGLGSKIEGMTTENFKTYLAQGRPIVFGATLGERFRKWSDKSVLSSDYNFSGGHAMVLVGYDDSKGTNGAFRIRNSWGQNYGDNGSIWVDYDLFLNSMCKYAYVAQNPNSPPPPEPINPPTPASNHYDLLASLAEDYRDDEFKPNDPRARAFYYQVHNNGSAEIKANKRWGIYYLYYNAYDAEDYAIIFEDYYTDEYGKPCSKPDDFKNGVCWGEYKNTEAIAGGLWNNINVKPGKMAGEEEAGDAGFEIPYQMPDITGDYYLVVYADSKDAIQESNEDNNFYFITSTGGRPLEFQNGVMLSSPINLAATTALAKRLRPAPVHSVAALGELNAYTPQEIKTVLNRDKKNGAWAKKIANYRETAKPVKRIKRR